VVIYCNIVTSVKKKVFQWCYVMTLWDEANETHYVDQSNLKHRVFTRLIRDDCWWSGIWCLLTSKIQQQHISLAVARCYCSDIFAAQTRNNTLMIHMVVLQQHPRYCHLFCTHQQQHLLEHVTDCNATASSLLLIWLYNLASSAKR